MLPDQLTVEALREIVSSYEARLKEDVTDRVEAELVSVHGARVIKRGIGYVEVEPAESVPVDFPSRPGVELRYRLIRPRHVEDVTFRSSPSRLVRVDSTWKDVAWHEPIRDRHVARLNRLVSTLTLRLVASTPTLLVGPLEFVPQGSAHECGCRYYEIPPAATVIHATGTLEYASGRAVELTGEPALLLREASGGRLEKRAGPVYATLLANEPGRIQIGQSWLETPHAE